MNGARGLLLFFFILRYGPGGWVGLVSASQGKPLRMLHPSWDSEATGVKVNASNSVGATGGKREVPRLQASLEL